MREHDAVRELERVYGLEFDLTPLERVLAYEPKTGAGQRYKTMFLRRWGRSVGLEPYQP
jgi:hypothetical protein